MKNSVAFLASLAALCGVAFTSPALAERPLTRCLGHPWRPGNNVTVGYEKFKQLVEEKSGRKSGYRYSPIPSWEATA